MYFFFNDTATTEIYTLSLHDALPIWAAREPPAWVHQGQAPRWHPEPRARAAPPLHGGGGRPHPGHARAGDRKSTRLNSSHANISYAVFCLKKKKHNNLELHQQINRYN